jgi:hypothetical protein
MSEELSEEKSSTMKMHAHNCSEVVELYLKDRYPILDDSNITEVLGSLLLLISDLLAISIRVNFAFTDKTDIEKIKNEIFDAIKEQVEELLE